MNPSCVKKTLCAGKGKVPEYKTGTKAVFHYEVLRPIDPVIPEIGMPSSRESYVSIDDTRKSWPHGYGKPLELVFGKKFQLPVFETCLQSMLVDEISQFDVEVRELATFALVSKKLRDIAMPCDGHGHGHDHEHHHHPTHMCAASMVEGTGYPVLDEYMKSPTPLRFIFHLLSVTQPEDYTPDGWQLTNEEKLVSIETLREEGNELFKQKEYKEAEMRYREALHRLDQLMLREKPGEPEWEDLDKKNIPLYLNLTQCLLNSKNFYDAQSSATEVLQRDPDNEKALYRRAKACIETWNLDEAENDLRRLVELYPKTESIVGIERATIQQKREEKAKGVKQTSKKMFRAFGN